MTSAKILKVTFKGLANFPDEGLTIDFLPHANVIKNDMDRNFIKLDKSLYYPKVNVITGANATGKTTLLELMDFMSALLSDSIPMLSYNFISLIKNELVIEPVVYIDGLIKGYTFHVSIAKGKISQHSIRYFEKEYSSRKLKNLYGWSSADYLEDSNEVGKVSLGVKAPLMFTQSYFPASTSISSSAIDLYKDDIDAGVLEPLIKVLDKNIESFSHDNGRFSLKFFGMEPESGLSAKDLFNRLSDGTKKTLLLFFMITNVIKEGGTLIIDEIENHLNKSIVDLIIDMFQDERINVNGANIIFSTHYAELLDEVNRSDAIFITDSVDGKLVINNAYTILKEKGLQRHELKKSKLYLSGAMNSKPSYDKVNEFKKAMRNMVRGE